MTSFIQIRRLTDHSSPVQLEEPRASNSEILKDDNDVLGSF